MERTDWLDGGLDSAAARQLSMPAIPRACTTIRSDKIF